MQLMENIFILLVIINIGLLVFKKKIKVQFFVGCVSFMTLSLILHFIIDNSRWQLYLIYVAYVLITFLSIYSIINSTNQEKNRLLRRITFIFSIVFVLVTGILKFSFPLYEIPLPSGDFSIGTESFVLIDSDREEIYGSELNRRIKVQVWYPAENTEDYELVPWLEDGRVVAQGLATDTGLPSFVLNHTELIMSNSHLKAPINETADSYPIVVISHGWRGFRNLHTDLAEELASIGYIAVSIDHTYGSVATVFGEDDVSFVNLDALPRRDLEPDFMDYANTLVNTYANDIVFTIDELEKMNAGINDSRFEGKLDMENIGLLGHSTGSGAGVTVAINDDRIKALFGMDAWVEPISDTEVDKGLNIPTLFLRSEQWQTGENNTNLFQLVMDNIGNTRLYDISGTTHYDFSMAYMYSPLTKPLGMTGELEGEYLVSIYKSMMTDFFDQTLKVNNNVGLIEIEDTWEEVRKIR